MNYKLALRKLTTSEMGRPSPQEARHKTRHPVRIIVENVRSAHNVGAILRTADALLIEEVHLTGFSPPGDHRAVHKSALGAQDSVPWSHEPDTLKVLRTLKEQGYTLVAIEITDHPRDARELDRSAYPIALLVGNEVSGISDQALALCDFAVELPQFGAKHSLNVSVATGVVGYDVVRRWNETSQK